MGMPWEAAKSASCSRAVGPAMPHRFSTTGLSTLVSRFRIIIFTGPIMEACMESEAMPRPTSAMASKGRPAISPQIEISESRPVSRPASAMALARLSTAGESVS